MLNQQILYTQYYSIKMPAVQLVLEKHKHTCPAGFLKNTLTAQHIYTVGSLTEIPTSTLHSAIRHSWRLAPRLLRYCRPSYEYPPPYCLYLDFRLYRRQPREASAAQHHLSSSFSLLYSPHTPSWEQRKVTCPTPLLSAISRAASAFHLNHQD